MSQVQLEKTQFSIGEEGGTRGSGNDEMKRMRFYFDGIFFNAGTFIRIRDSTPPQGSTLGERHRDGTRE